MGDDSRQDERICWRRMTGDDILLLYSFMNFASDQNIPQTALLLRKKASTVVDASFALEMECPEPPIAAAEGMPLCCDSKKPPQQ